MRPLFVVLAGLCASTTTSLAVWAAISMERAAEPPSYSELLEGSLIRTNLPERRVNTHLEDVLLEFVREEGTRTGPKHKFVTRAWFADPDFRGFADEKASRLIYRQEGVQGATLRVDVIRDKNASALIFFEHESPEVVQRSAKRLAELLQREVAMGSQSKIFGVI